MIFKGKSKISKDKKKLQQSKSKSQLIQLLGKVLEIRLRKDIIV